MPVTIAVGPSSLAIAALGIELTPLTTVAGPLVIAAGTEFSVLVAARYVEERRRGLAACAAVTAGVPRFGRAFVAYPMAAGTSSAVSVNPTPTS